MVQVFSIVLEAPASYFLGRLHVGNGNKTELRIYCSEPYGGRNAESLCKPVLELGQKRLIEQDIIFVQCQHQIDLIGIPPFNGIEGNSLSGRGFQKGKIFLSRQFLPFPGTVYQIYDTGSPPYGYPSVDRFLEEGFSVFPSIFMDPDQAGHMPGYMVEAQYIAEKLHYPGKIGGVLCTHWDAFDEERKRYLLKGIREEEPLRPCLGSFLSDLPVRIPAGFRPVLYRRCFLLSFVAFTVYQG